MVVLELEQGGGGPVTPQSFGFECGEYHTEDNRKVVLCQNISLCSKVTRALPRAPFPLEM